MGKYFTYIIESQKDKSYYIGYTSDLERRIQNHNLGRSKYTSGKLPWRVIYFEEFYTKLEALKRERELKKKKSKEYIDKYILR